MALKSKSKQRITGVVFVSMISRFQKHDMFIKKKVSKSIQFSMVVYTIDHIALSVLVFCGSVNRYMILGVKCKKKMSIFARYSEMSIKNWFCRVYVFNRLHYHQRKSTVDESVKVHDDIEVVIFVDRAFSVVPIPFTTSNTTRFYVTQRI